MSILPRPAIRPVDAETARREAESAGRHDGAKHYPSISASEPANDYTGLTYLDEAHTTGSAIIASHFSDLRVADEEALAKARPQTARRIGTTRHRRIQYEERWAEERAIKQGFPLSAKAPFWTARTVGTILTVLGIGTAAAVIAALQAATEDRFWLSCLIGLAGALSAVTGGAALGALLRRRDLDDLEEGAYSARSRRWMLVVVIGVLGVMAIGGAIAALRQAGSEADAARRAERSAITVTLPDRPQLAGQAQRAPREYQAGVVSRWIWLLFELGVAAAAITIEYQRADVRVEHMENAEKGTHDACDRWLAEHEALAVATTALDEARLTRAAHDAAATAAAEAQEQFAACKDNAYRHQNLSTRGHVNGDPWRDVIKSTRGTLVTWLAGHPGVDLTPSTPLLGASSNDERIDRMLLDAAYEELSRTPEHPQRADAAPWIPGEYLWADCQAKALQHQLAGRKQNHEKSGTQQTSGLPEAAMPTGSNNPFAAHVASNGLHTSPNSSDGDGSHT